MSSSPSKAALSGRRLGSRSRARSVLSWARVKSSVNQSVTFWPLIRLVVRMVANSGWVATSVVSDSRFSCRATSTPSLVGTRSGSM